jgi:hypothetical protein
MFALFSSPSTEIPAHYLDQTTTSFQIRSSSSFISHASGSQKGVIRDQFPGDPWIQFCDGCFEVYLFFK